jgi:adenylyltransferase/sulfurtransferase
MTFWRQPASWLSPKSIEERIYMPVLRIPTPLRAYTNGQSEVNVRGSNISDALADLTTQYPALKPHLFNEGGELRPFVNLFVGENNIKDLQGVDTPIQEGQKIMLIPSIAGGCHTCTPRRRPTGAVCVRCECCASSGSNLLLSGGQYVTS